MKTLMKYLKKNPTLIITDIDQLFEELEIDFINEDGVLDDYQLLEAKKEIIRHNIRILDKEMKKAEEVKKKIAKLEEEVIQETKKEITATETHPTKLRVVEMRDVNPYVIQLLNCELEDEYPLILPREDNEKYEEVLNYILLQVQSEIIEYKKMLEGTSEEDRQELLSDIHKLQNIMQYIINKKMSKNSDSVEAEDDTPSIYFLTRSRIGERVSLIEEDLENILDSENTRSFKKLIEEFLNGRFLEKMGKWASGHSYTNNQTMRGLNVAKHNQARITYVHLGGNNYILIKAFLKKDDTSLLVTGNIRNNFEHFKAQEEQIRENIQSPEYQLEQATYLENTLRLLRKYNGGEE